MGSSITFTIVDGAAPFTVELVNSTIPIKTYSMSGTYTISDVPNGVYTLKITDSNDCVFEKVLTVNPTITTTTTTEAPGNSIVIGHAQDPLLIFNPTATNRNSEYSGYPDLDTVTLYLWFKTLNGEPLTTNKSFSYEIAAPNVSNASYFEYVDVSDQIHAIISEGSVGPVSPLTGSIILETGFIESFFKYIYFRGSADKRFSIDIITPQNNIYTGIPTKDDSGKTYGITTLENNKITLDY